MSLRSYMKFVHGLTLICPDRRFIWFAIPKCATMSISEAIKQQCDAIEINSQIHSDYPIDYDDFKNNWFKFAFVRNPAGRALSFYFDKILNFRGSDAQKKILRTYPTLNTEMSVSDYVDWLETEEGNNSNADPHYRQQWDFLVNKNGDYMMNFLGDVQKLDECLDRIHERTGIRSDTVKYRNLNSSSEVRPNRAVFTTGNYREYVNDDEWARLEKRFCIDFAMLGPYFQESTRSNSTTIDNCEIKICNDKLINLKSPRPLQVFQRHKSDLTGSLLHDATARGHAVVSLAWDWCIPDELDQWFVGIRITSPTFKKPLFEAVARLSDCVLRRDGPFLQCAIEVTLPAGGWYVGSLVLIHNREIVLNQSLPPFGVGEIFIAAGQSYMAHTGDQFFAASDTHARVVGYAGREMGWLPGNDPFPHFRRETDPQSDHAAFLGRYLLEGRSFAGGSVWPLALSTIASILDVPVALVNLVSPPPDAISHWRPGTPKHETLVEACREVGAPRAVLWGHGESDAFYGTSTGDYVATHRDMRHAINDLFKENLRWIVAKSTLHDPLGASAANRAAIRNAIDEIWRDTDVSEGPDTDMLMGPHRAGDTGSKHFTALGQERAAHLWSASILRALYSCENQNRRGSDG